MKTTKFCHPTYFCNFYGSQGEMQLLLYTTFNDRLVQSRLSVFNALYTPKLIFVFKGINVWSLRGFSYIAVEPQQNQAQDTVPINMYCTVTSPVHLSYYIPISVTSKVIKQFPCAGHEGTLGSEATAPLILNLRTRCGLVVCFNLFPVPFGRRMNGPRACLGVLEQPETSWPCQEPNRTAIPQLSSP
jgi:hypothetical protein